MSPRPIWEIAPHLCSFSSIVARRRLLLPLKVYADESGSDDNSPVFVMAGFIARAEQWAAFEEEWKAILAEPPAIAAFHTKDAKWAGYYARLPRLVEVIRKHVLMGFAVTISHVDYKAEIKGRMSKAVDDPYYMGFLGIINVAALWQVQNGLKENMDFLFDDRKDKLGPIELSFASMMADAPSYVQDRVGLTPVHGKDEDVLALQAADILAWSLRRFEFLADQGQPEDKALRSLIDTLPLKHHRFERNDLRTLVNIIDVRSESDGSITQHQYAKAAPYLDKLLASFNADQIADAKPGDTIPLMSFPASETKRFVLVHSCAQHDKPHLHKRSGGECLGGD